MSLSFKGLRGVYLTTFFLNFGLGLLGIFIPLYLWQITGSLSFVFYFFAVYYLMVVLASLAAGWLFKKALSPDAAYFFSVLTRLIYLFFLVRASSNFFYLLGAAFFWGLTIPFCWFPYFLTVVYEKKGRGYFGREVSLMGILSQLSAAAAPVLSGVVISRWGFDWAYFLAGIFFLISFLPLYFDDYRPRRESFSLRDTFSFIFLPSERKLRRAFWGSGLVAAAGIAWPLFIFNFLRTYQVVGWIKGLSLFFSVLALWWVGRKIDKRKGEVINWGVGLGVVNWFLRILAQTPVTFFLFDFWANLAGILINTPLQALIYQKARGRYSPLEVFVAQNFVSNLAGFFACLLLALLTEKNYFFLIAFSLGAIGVFLIKGNDGRQLE